jgi:hypothetical protein
VRHSGASRNLQYFHPEAGWRTKVLESATGAWTKARLPGLFRCGIMEYSGCQPNSASASTLRPLLKGARFVSALARNTGAFGRNPVALVLRDETTDVLA